MCVSSREINADAIYLKVASQSFKNLTQAKIDLLLSANAYMIDSDVAFYGWVDNTNCFYVKDFEKSNTFAVYLYNTQNRKKITL